MDPAGSVQNSVEDSMRVFVFASIVLLASCSSGPSSEEAARASEVEKLGIKLAQYQDKAMAVTSDLVDRVGKLEGKISQQRDLIDVLQIDIRKLRSEMDALKCGASSPPSRASSD